MQNQQEIIYQINWIFYEQVDRLLISQITNSLAIKHLTTFESSDLGFLDFFLFSKN